MISTTPIKQGTLSATRTRPDGDAAAYLGIPYARAPVGDMRWKPPGEAPSWTGVRAADHYGSVCPQYTPPSNSLYYPGVQPESEDCLFLNVWSAAKDRTERRPVMVWFHMGAFAFGSSSWLPQPDRPSLFDGSHLASLGVVMVTVNYRLGRFGFLAHPWLRQESSTQTSGNYGFLDQVAALQWVRDNIAAFGGDPNCVTLCGVSAGSASCNLHMTSPLSKGLFHRAIAGSAAFFSPPANNSGVYDRLLDSASAEQRGVLLSDALRVKDLNELRRASPLDILNAALPSGPAPWFSPQAQMNLGDGTSDASYPIVDGYAVPAGPADIFAAGQQNDVPLLTGSTLKESTGLPGIQSLEGYRHYVEAEFGSLAGRCFEVYPANDDASAFHASGDMLGDRVFGWQNWTWAKAAQSTGKSAVYYYDWLHAPPFPDATYVEGDSAPAHGADMPYIFQNQDAFAWPWKPADAALSQMVARYWTNFARSGDPNGPQLPRWEAFDAKAPRAMQLSAAPHMDEPSRQRRFALIDDYYGRSM